MAVGTNGNILLSGWVSLLLDESFAFDSIAIPKSAGFELGMAFVGELDAQGDARWVRRIPGGNSAYGPPLGALDATGAARVTGLDPGHNALYLAQYGP